MSKILMALTKSKELKQRALSRRSLEGERKNEEDGGLLEREQGIISLKAAGVFVALLIMTGISLLINFRALNELKRTKTIMAAQANSAMKQKREMAKLVSLVSARGKEEKATLQEITSSSVSSPTTDFHNIEEMDIKELKADYKTLLTLIEDLKLSDKLLLEKYILLNDEVRNLRMNATAETFVEAIKQQ